MFHRIGCAGKEARHLQPGADVSGTAGGRAGEGAEEGAETTEEKKEKEQGQVGRGRD